MRNSWRFPEYQNPEYNGEQSQLTTPFQLHTLPRVDRCYKAPLVAPAAKPSPNPFTTSAFPEGRTAPKEAATTNAASLNPSPFPFPSCCLSCYSSLRTPLTHCIFGLTQARSFCTASKQAPNVSSQKPATEERCKSGALTERASPL